MFAIQNYNFNTDRNTEKRTGEEVYFEGSKKNELNDIKNYLKSIVSDPEKEFFRKELIKKVIAYTTSGIDTSRLYPEIVMASATKDLVEKKLIYQYLSIYSSANENFARMAINTFMKDCSSPNPNIRAFAARNLSNLRFKGRQEYSYPILMAGLDDFSPLVRKSCIMGLTKLIVERNRTLETPVRDQHILTKFYEMIRESDSSLVCTAIEAINQIEQEGIVMSKKLAKYLLDNINNFGYLQLPVILNYFELYDPKTEEEIVGILNTLQPKFKSSSASVALGISKIYLKMSKLKPDLSKHIYDAIRGSLLSFLNNDTPQIEYVVLKHIQYIIATFKATSFNNDYKKLLLGINQPTYVKTTKLNILQLLINHHNLSDIVNEFAEYMIDEDISKEAVEAMAKTLLIADESEAKLIIKTIIKVVETTAIPYIGNNVLPLIRNYLRVYPKDFPMFSSIFYNLVENAKDEDARCSIIEIIGDYGELIEDAVQLIAWNQNEISDNLKISMLRANTKLFLKRPHQMCNLLSSMFRNILTDDNTHLHVKDYAAFLYRALQSDIDEFKVTFLDCRTQTKAVQKVYQELQFNSLEVVYSNKEQKWLLHKLKYIEVDQEIEIEELEEEEQQPDSRGANIDVDSKFKKLEADNFDVTFTLPADQFERCWEQYDIGSSITRIVKNIDLLTEQNLQELFRIWNITVLASAQTEDEIKIYNYCKVIETQSDLGTACMQFCIHKLPQTLTLMIKCDNDELAGFISRYIEDFLRINDII